MYKNNKQSFLEQMGLNSASFSKASSGINDLKFGPDSEGEDVCLYVDDENTESLEKEFEQHIPTFVNLKYGQ